MVQLDGGRFATSDLNDLYRRVINRNNRLGPPAQPRRAGDHRQQREAHAAGGRRRAVRQRPPRPPGHRPGQPPAEVAVGHAEGQAGPVPPEPARQARRLLRPLGHRRRPDAAAAPVRPAQADGARAVQAVRDEAPRRPRAGAEHQDRQADGRAPPRPGVGRPRGRHQGAPGAAQPGADAAPPGHPGVRAGARRGQGAADPPARVHGVQRRLRRRPDGHPRAAVGRGAGRGPGADAVGEQHPVAGVGSPDRDPDPGPRHRRLLPHRGHAGRQGRGPRVPPPVGGAAGLRRGRASTCTPRSRCGHPPSGEPCRRPRSAGPCSRRPCPTTTPRASATSPRSSRSARWA